MAVEPEKKETLNIKVSPSVNAYLNKCKSEGILKTSWMDDAVIVIKWFNNRVSYKKTRESFLALWALEAAREDAKLKGAYDGELLKIDDAISAVQEVLERYEKGEKKP